MIFALSALTRGNVKSVETFHVLGGFKIIQKILETRETDLNLILKSLSLISDLTSDEQTQTIDIIDENWCKLLKSQSLYENKDLDHIGNVLLIYIVSFT